MSPLEGRCNLPTKTSTLCKREPGSCPHIPARETLGQLYPAQVLEQATAIVQKLTNHHQGQQAAPPSEYEDEPPVTSTLEDEPRSPFEAQDTYRSAGPRSDVHLEEGDSGFVEKVLGFRATKAACGLAVDDHL